VGEPGWQGKNYICHNKITTLELKVGGILPTFIQYCVIDVT